MRIRSRPRQPARSGLERTARAALGAGLCLALLLPSAAFAGGRMLRGLELRPAGETTFVRVRFATPVRILRQSPSSEGSWVRIELSPLPGREAFTGFPNELRRPPAGLPGPLEEVAFHARSASLAELDLRFAQRVRFQVAPGDDLRSLVVAVELIPEATEEGAEAGQTKAHQADHAKADQADQTKAGQTGPAKTDQGEARPVGRAPARPAPAPGDAQLADTYVREGRAALEAGDYDRAILLLDEAAAMAPHPRSAEARELLGVTRERNGQRAHAQAEYLAYLDQWPEGPGAVRVRQRLDALLTAADRPRPALREARDPVGPRPPTGAPRNPLDDVEIFGSVYTAYSRVERESEGSGRAVDDSSFFHDVFTQASLRRDDVEVRAELQASYFLDLLDDDDDWRVSNLFVEIDPRRGRLSGAFGRLPGNRAGVLGRFDGVRLHYQQNPGLAFNAVAGMPFDPFIETGIDPSRVFVGASVETTLFEDLRLELYGIQQWADGLRDRSGVGAEFSWTRRGQFLAGVVDYDVAFRELNTAFLVGTWQPMAGTTVNALLDYRRLPTLTRRTALFGQTEDSLDDLRLRFGDGQLDDLALDRSVRSRSATLGVTQTLTRRLQLSGELSLNDFTGSPASGGVGAFPGSGLQVGTYLQLLVSDLFREGDVVTLGLRNLRSRDLDLLALELHWRAALTRRLRVDPFFRIEHRDHRVTGGVMTYRPGLRLDYRVGALNLDTEFSYGWGRGERFLGEGDEEGYFMLVGARWDF